MSLPYLVGPTTMDDTLDLARVVRHPGFVELSYWPDLKEPWAVGIAFGIAQPPQITWFRHLEREGAIRSAVCGIEQWNGLSLPERICSR